MIFKCIKSVPNFTIGKSYLVINEVTGSPSWKQYLILNDLSKEQWVYTTSFITINEWREKQLNKIEI